MAFKRSDFVRVFAKARQAENPQWRWGQTLFNTTWQLYPDLATKVQGTMYDPFNLNSRADGFLEWLDRQGGES